MPELPEVETIVRDLATVLPGRRIENVRTGHPSVFRFPDVRSTTRLLRGRSISAIERRGKYIDCHLDSGDDLVVHLGMTGHLLVTDAEKPEAPHTHLRALLDDGRELRFDDARRFGRILVGDLEMLQESGAIDMLLTWGLSDRYTWLREDDPELTGGALPLDADYNRTAFWETLRSGWAEV